VRRKKPKVAQDIADRAAAIFDAFAGRILPIDRAVAGAWGEALAVSEKHKDDAGFAATARIRGLTIVSRNTKDFVNLGVSVLNPYKRPPEVLPC
jgi:predicted nucleic acid-binding protein